MSTHTKAGHPFAKQIGLIHISDGQGFALCGAELKGKNYISERCPVDKHCSKCMKVFIPKRRK